MGLTCCAWHFLPIIRSSPHHPHPHPPAQAYGPIPSQVCVSFADTLEAWTWLFSCCVAELFTLLELFQKSCDTRTTFSRSGWFSILLHRPRSELTFEVFLIATCGSWVNLSDRFGFVLIYPGFTVSHKDIRFVNRRLSEKWFCIQNERSSCQTTLLVLLTTVLVCMQSSSIWIIVRVSKGFKSVYRVAVIQTTH